MNEALIQKPPTTTTNNVSYQQRIREHTQFRVHNKVGNTIATVNERDGGPS